MREIKFRGKDVHTGQWRYGDYTHSQGVGPTNEQPIIKRVMVGGYEVDEQTIGQSTGMYDEYEKPIYEGDIVKVRRGDGWINTYEMVWKTQTARYVLREQFGVTEDIAFLIGVPMMVIGNIHDNSDLLKKEHNAD